MIPKIFSWRVMLIPVCVQELRDHGRVFTIRALYVFGIRLAVW
jgi:hypothetical protein